MPGPAIGVIFPTESTLTPVKRKGESVIARVKTQKAAMYLSLLVKLIEESGKICDRNKKMEFDRTTKNIVMRIRKS
ncbi:MAG TPA: hypothetical protein VFW77_04115 [Candidatus Saccharimonadales bacterium]|nr:hypothetical protein [Candidatus Saccharimonadales bacterium]